MKTDRKRRIVTAYQRYGLNPFTKLVAGSIFTGWVLLETTGRTSGKPRRTPLGGTLEGDAFWIVSEQGRRAQYVRNIEKDPRVRLRIRRRWRTGTAHVVPGDDAIARTQTQNVWNRRAVRMFGTDLLSVRIDLDPT
jgi:deazaflavin-dependent oxidoreductase (nitroreductase family)